MPIPLAPVIAAGASLLGSGVNALATTRLNKKTMKWNEKMYATQRAHNLQDWATQNEYNSPQAQMDRLKAAGLNPKLIYGEGQTTTPAGDIGKADVKSWTPDAPQVDLSSAIGAFQDYQMKQVQTDNLRKSGDLMVLDGILKTKESIQRDLVTETGKFDLEQKRRLADTYADLAEQQLAKATADTNKVLQDIDIAQLMKEPNLQQALQNIAQQKLTQAKTAAETANVKATLENIRQDTRLKKADAELREKGIYPGDPLWLRALIQNVEKFFKSGPGVIDSLGLPKPPVGGDKLDSTGKPYRNKLHPSKTWNRQ